MDAVETRVSKPRLRRSLGLWHLVMYGVIVIQPTAPMPLFGLLEVRGQGHVVTTVLIAMLAMLFTCLSYGRMARVYPSAGSAFTYVGQELNPTLGYVTGWSMLMDYMLNPIICVIWVSNQIRVFVPEVPYWVWAILIAFLFTWLNILRIRTSARINAGLTAAMGLVIAIFLAAVARYVYLQPSHPLEYFTRPFYDPTTFLPKSVLSATSIAVLTFIGFDGITTLSEEAENPGRDIMLATVLTCIVIGFLAAVECYAAQLLWPSPQPFPDVTTAFSYLVRRAWPPLVGMVGITLIVSNFGSGMAAHLGAARLLYGMGRSNALPSSFFGAVEPKRHIPRNNVLFIGTIALAGGFALSYDLGAQMLNFGALIAFMGVNLAALTRFYVRNPEKKVTELLPPLLGFLICLVLWLNLSHLAFILGSVWMLVGIVFGAWRTRWFQRKLVNFDFAEES